jgi:carbonic anhydrase
METNNWSFTDTSNWGGNCSSGINQSPINIDTESTIQCEALCDLKINYKPSTCNVKFNNGVLKLNIANGSYILYNNVYYKLNYITIHTPSMHQLDGEIYDMEICFVHSNGTNPDAGGVILSCFYQQGHHYGNTETFFNQFINDTPAFNLDFEETVEVSNLWGPHLLIPEMKSFYTYEGSLYMPPCSNGYTNIVMESIGNIGPTNLDLLKKYLGSNIRQVQNIGSRKVYYSPGKPIKPSEREVTTTNDRFLRCVRKPQGEINATAAPSTTNAPPQGFNRCYTDNENSRVLTKDMGYVTSLSQCNDAANSNSSPVFGIYEALDEDGTRKYRCFVKGSNNGDYTNFSNSTACTVDSNGVSHGNETNVAIYNSTKEYSLFSKSTKQYIKNVFMLIFIVLIALNAIYITKFLFKYRYFQTFLISLIGMNNFISSDPYFELEGKECPVIDKSSSTLTSGTTSSSSSISNNQKETQITQIKQKENQLT